MLNLEEINNTIEELENSPTTFDTCIKLSALYNVREHLSNAVPSHASTVTNDVINELSDILPHYRKYVEVKTSYQLGNASSDIVQKYMNSVCKEIDEFIITLYCSTDMPEERFLLYNAISEVLTKIRPE